MKEFVEKKVKIYFIFHQFVLMIINQNSFKEEKESFNELIEFIQSSLAAIFFVFKSLTLLK